MHQAKRGIRENIHEPYAGAGSLISELCKDVATHFFLSGLRKPVIIEFTSQKLFL
jgi:hypothetical protein